MHCGEMATQISNYLVEHKSNPMRLLSIGLVQRCRSMKLSLRGSDIQKISKLNDDQKKELEEIVKNVVNDEKFVLKLESMDSKENPFIITNPEFMRNFIDLNN